MGKISVNEIDFDELDSVVADILLEKQQGYEEPRERANESGQADEPGVGHYPEHEEEPGHEPRGAESLRVEPEMQIPRNYDEITPDYRRAPVVDEEVEREAIIDNKPWRIVQRARKMRDLSGSELLAHNQIRTTKRFGRSLTPSEGGLTDLADEVRAVEVVEDELEKKVEATPQRTRVPVRRAVKKNDETEVEKKDDEYIKVQQEILWEITKEIRRKEERSAARIHKGAARVATKKVKPTRSLAKRTAEPPMAKDVAKPMIREVSKPMVVAEATPIVVKRAVKSAKKTELATKPESVVRPAAKPAVKPKRVGVVKFIENDNLQTVKPKADAMKFAGDEFSEEIDEQKTVRKNADSPFIGGVKVAKKPLGGGVGSGSVDIISSRPLEVILPNIPEPEIRELKTPKIVSSPKLVKKDERKHRKSPRALDGKRGKAVGSGKDKGSWYWVLLLVFTIVIGAMAGALMFFLTSER